MNTTENSTGTISNVLTMIRMSTHSLDDVSSRSHHRSFLTAITISSHFCSVPDMGYFHSAVRQLEMSEIRRDAPEIDEAREAPRPRWQAQGCAPGRRNAAYQRFEKDSAGEPGLGRAQQARVAGQFSMVQPVVNEALAASAALKIDLICYCLLHHLHMAVENCLETGNSGMAVYATAIAGTC